MYHVGIETTNPPLQEMNSNVEPEPMSFHRDNKRAHVVVACTPSKSQLDKGKKRE